MSPFLVGAGTLLAGLGAVLAVYFAAQQTKVAAQQLRIAQDQLARQRDLADEEFIGRVGVTYDNKNVKVINANRSEATILGEVFIQYNSEVVVEVQFHFVLDACREAKIKVPEAEEVIKRWAAKSEVGDIPSAREASQARYVSQLLMHFVDAEGKVWTKSQSGAWRREAEDQAFARSFYQGSSLPVVTTVELHPEGHRLAGCF
ncbi:hypothetical protein ACIBHY_20585 [Nonomuraea sp. NPDC050547]|uniref:hypothetical protein n=1 Tax=Nonomuraea sp. NPDC050547 TaxID=3364368 RepID=UPI00379B5237